MHQDLTIEILKHAATKALEIIRSKFDKCMKGENITKKPPLNKRSIYKGISITLSVGRLYRKIFKARIERQSKEIEEQSGSEEEDFV